MKKQFLVLVALLMVSMVTITQSPNGGTRIFVNPSSIVNPALQPQVARTIRPNADGSFGEWTNSTVVLRPNSDGTYSDWTGRILTLSPNGSGTYNQWSAWTHLQPTTSVDQNYTDWGGLTNAWDDWPNPDGNFISASDSSYNNKLETSALMPSPIERRSLTIQKLRVNIVAGYSAASDEQVQMMLCTVYNANVSSFTAASGWNGWTRNGTSPWLSKEDYPTNSIASSVGGDRIGNFTFYDIPADIAWSPKPGGVTVRFRTWQSDEGDDTIDIYVYNGTHWEKFTGLQPVDAPDPSYVQYGHQTDMDVSSFLNTREKINAAKMAIEKVTVGDPDTIYIDYACIHLSGVTTASSYGVTTGLTPSYRTYYSDWPTNPFTGSAWTWSDLDALQAGVRAIQVGLVWSGTLKVEQLYVGILTNQGFYTDWDEYPAPTGPNGGDEDLFSATADALSQSSALTNHSSETWPISKVRVTAVASNPDTLYASGREVVSGWDTGWSKIGNDPWLDAADYSSNYISSSSTSGAKIGNFTFRDVAAGTTWDTVTLRFKIWKTGSPSMTVYMYNGISWAPYPVTPTGTSPTSPESYVDIDVSSFLNTEAKINAAKMAIVKSSASGSIYLDYACLSLGDREKIQLMVGIPPFEFQANVDGFDNTLTGWTRTGSSPYLGAADYSANYISTIGSGVQIGDFSFQNVPSGTTWGTVKLRLKTWQSSGGDDQLSIYLFDGTIWSSAYTVTPSTTAGYYPDIDVSGFLNTEAKINAAKMRLTKLRVGGGGSDDTVYVDHAYLYLSRVSYGVETALTTTYANYTSEWSTSPATGLAWTWAEIDALEVGVRSRKSGNWIGEIRVTQLYVNVIEAGSYAAWDEPPPSYNGDEDYVSALAGGLNQTSGLENQPVGITWTPTKVQVTIVARRTGGDDQLRIRMRLGTTNVDSVNLFLPSGETAYTSYTYSRTTDPTGGAWSWDGINALEVGVVSVTVGASFTELRVTQLYVVVCRDGTYENWDETSANGDTDYFSATMGALKESSQLDDVASPPTWDIGRVRVVIVAKTDLTTDDQVQLILVIGGTMFQGPAFTPTTSYQTYMTDWGKNPKYNIPWDWAAIDSLEAGVYSVRNGTTWEGEIRITQLYVEIAGPKFTVNIDVENVTNLLGYRIRLKYDTTVTTATGIIFNYTSFFTSQSLLTEEVNDPLGYVELAAQSTAGLKSGNGTLATIVFLVDSVGTTALDLAVKEFYTSGFVEIYSIVGDVERDRTIDASDLSLFSDAYGVKYPDPNWGGKYEYCDFNGDLKVDVFDLFAQSRNFGKTYAYDGSFSNG